MTLYLDTSAFIKMYVAEPGAEKVREAIARARALHTHLITYAEMRAALARLHRAGRETAASHRQHVREFERDWQALAIVVPDERMIRRAGDLAEQFGLRGYDSVHLAAVESLVIDRRHPVHFASFDDALNAAAADLGLQVLAAAPRR
ncbi:MAG: type II toxin-antitoxin system VapC family toxin [Sulfuricaulis sp.]|uniref:type II toxin-antitoxin system VapC family toxin n=1 Tax=Sulfuricaulis sp. TaxID=2003553 RepID=UPI0034A4FADA